MNLSNLTDSTFYSLAVMDATCECGHCRPKVESSLVKLQSNVIKWERLNNSQASNPYTTEAMDRHSINATNILNKLRRLHHRPTHFEGVVE